MKRLYEYLAEDYQNTVKKISSDSKKPRALGEHNISDKSENRERILQGTTSENWDPKDGLEQIFWKSIKIFQSTYLANDIFEMNLYVMGDNSSGQNGFDVDSYEIFKGIVIDGKTYNDGKVCFLAETFKAKLLPSVNL